MKKAIILSILFCFALALPAQAKDVWEMAESPVYKEKAGGMLGRGALNVVTCPVDIPVQIVNGAKKNRPEFMGALGGLATGAMCTVLRAGSGIIDVATFWVPGFNGLPVNRSYDNCLASSGESSYVPPTTVYEQTAPATQKAAPAKSRLKYVKK